MCVCVLYSSVANVSSVSLIALFICFDYWLLQLFFLFFIAALVYWSTMACGSGSTEDQTGQNTNSKKCLYYQQ